MTTQTPNISTRIDAFLTSCRARGLSASTIDAYQWALDKLPTRDATPEALERRLAQLELATESRWDVYRVWRTFHRWSTRRYNTPNPIAEIATPRHPRHRPKTIDWSIVERALALATNRRDRAILLLLMDSGLRLKEIASLTPSSVLTTSILVNAKGGYVREVPISADVRRTLIGVLPWTGRKGPLTANGISQIVRRLLAKAGVTGGPHTLRHTFAISYIEDGGDVFSLQRILGHAQLSTTEIYARMDLRATSAQHRKHSPALRLIHSDEEAQEAQ